MYFCSVTHFMTFPLRYIIGTFTLLSLGGMIFIQTVFWYYKSFHYQMQMIHISQLVIMIIYSTSIFKSCFCLNASSDIVNYIAVLEHAVTIIKLQWILLCRFCITTHFAACRSLILGCNNGMARVYGNMAIFIWHWGCTYQCIMPNWLPWFIQVVKQHCFFR